MICVIGLGGKVGVGKTVTCKYMARTLRQMQVRHVMRLSFADALREELLTDSRLENKERITLEMTRQNKGMKVVYDGKETTLGSALQMYGEEKRKKNPEYWCARLMEKLNDARLLNGSWVLIDDVRHKNEAKLVGQILSGYAVRLNPYEGWSMPDGRDPKHRSEVELDGWRGWNLVRTPVYGSLGLEANLILEIANQYFGGRHAFVKP